MEKMEQLSNSSVRPTIVDSSLLLDKHLGYEFAQLYENSAITTDNVNQFVAFTEFVAGCSSNNLPTFCDTASSVASKIVSDISDFQIPANSKYLVIDNPHGSTQKYIVNITTPTAPVIVSSKNYYLNATQNYSQFKCVVAKCSLRQMSIETMTSLVGVLGDGVILNSQLSVIPFTDNPMSIQIPEYKKIRSVNMHKGISGLVFGTPYSHYLEQNPLTQFADIFIFGQPGTTNLFIPPFSDITIYYIGAATFTIRYEVLGSIYWSASGSTTTTANHVSFNSGPFAITSVLSTTTNTYNMIVDLTDPREDYFCVILSTSAQAIQMRSDTTIAAQLTVKQTAASDIPTSVPRHCVDYSKVKEVVNNTGMALTEGNYERGHAWSLGSLLSDAWDFIKKPLGNFITTIGSQLQGEKKQEKSVNKRVPKRGRAMISSKEEKKPSLSTVYHTDTVEIEINPEIQSYFEKGEKGYYVALAAPGNIHDIKTSHSIKILNKNEIPSHINQTMIKNNLVTCYLLNMDDNKLDISIISQHGQAKILEDNVVSMEMDQNNYDFYDLEKSIEKMIKPLNELVFTQTPKVAPEIFLNKPNKTSKQINQKEGEKHGHAMIELKLPPKQLVNKGNEKMTTKSKGLSSFIASGVNFFDSDGDITHANRIGRPIDTIPAPALPSYQFFPIVIENVQDVVHTIAAIMTDTKLKDNEYYEVAQFSNYEEKILKIFIHKMCVDGNADELLEIIKWCNNNWYLSNYESDIYINFASMDTNEDKITFDGGSWYPALMSLLCGMYSGQFITGHIACKDDNIVVREMKDKAIKIKKEYGRKDLPLIFVCTDATFPDGRYNYNKLIIQGDRERFYQTRTPAEFLDLVNRPLVFKGYKPITNQYPVDTNYFSMWCHEWENTIVPYLIVNDPSFGKANFETMLQVCNNDPVDINRFTSMFRDLTIRSQVGAYLNVVTPSKGKRYTVDSLVVDENNIDFIKNTFRVNVMSGNQKIKHTYIHKNYQSTAKVFPLPTNKENIDPLLNSHEKDQIVHGDVIKYLKQEIPPSILALEYRNAQEKGQQKIAALRADFTTLRDKKRNENFVLKVGGKKNTIPRNIQRSKSQVRRFYTSESANDQKAREEREARLLDNAFDKAINIDNVSKRVVNNNRNQNMTTLNNNSSVFNGTPEPPNESEVEFKKPPTENPIYTIIDYKYKGLEDPMISEDNLFNYGVFNAYMRDMKLSKDFDATFGEGYGEYTNDETTNLPLSVIKNITYFSSKGSFGTVADYFLNHPGDALAVKNIMFSQKGTVTPILLENQSSFPQSYSSMAPNCKLRQLFRNNDDKNCHVYMLFDFLLALLGELKVVSPFNGYIGYLLEKGIVKVDSTDTKYAAFDSQSFRIDENTKQVVRLDKLSDRYTLFDFRRYNGVSNTNDLVDENNFNDSINDNQVDDFLNEEV